MYGQADGKPAADVPFQPYCMYDGKDIGVSIYKDTKFTVDALHSQAQWAKWDPTDLNGHPAVTAIDSGSTKARICDTMFDAGRGRIDVQVAANHPGDNSACDKSQEIAKQIAPRMPQKQ